MLVEGIPFPKSAVDCIFCFVQAGVPGLFQAFPLCFRSKSFHGIGESCKKNSTVSFVKTSFFLLFHSVRVVKKMDKVILGNSLNINK